MEYDGSSGLPLQKYAHPHSCTLETLIFLLLVRAACILRPMHGDSQIRNRIHRTDRGCLAQLCPLCREGDQRPRFAGICFKSDSAPSTRSHSKCRGCGPVGGLLGYTLVLWSQVGDSHADPACIIPGEASPAGVLPAAQPCPQLLESRLV